MNIPAPLAGLQTFEFSDVDEFRQSVRAVQVTFTPLARKISASQTILNLPGCDINLVATFPRVIDVQLRPDCTAVGFSMDDRLPLVMNGIEADQAFLAVGHGGGGYTAVEKAGVRFTSMMFTPEVHDRGWPYSGRDFAMYAMTRAAQQNLRSLVLEVMKFASDSPEELNAPGVAAGIKESLLSAIDHAFNSRVTPLAAGSMHSARYLEIIRKVEGLLSDDLGNPVYSGELARAVGVSVRTLHSSVLEHRGMSLHRYLRLKRLWLVRQELRAGDTSIKACALAHGFWHLGEFSKSYRQQFGETPSQTLAGSR